MTESAPVATEELTQLWQMMRAVVAAAEEQDAISPGTASLTFEGDEYYLTLGRMDDLLPASADDAGQWSKQR